MELRLLAIPTAPSMSYGLLADVTYNSTYKKKKVKMFIIVGMCLLERIDDKLGTLLLHSWVPGPKKLTKGHFTHKPSAVTMKW